MEINKKPARIHPLVAGASISVMLVSLTGIAAMTGLLPNSHSTDAPASSQLASAVGAAAAASSPAALVEATPKAQVHTPQVQAELQETPAEPKKAAPRQAQAKETPARRTSYAEPARVASAPIVCHSCGRVESVQAIKQQAQGSGVGMVAGAVLGGVLGNQVGGGNGRKLATVAGAVGGGYAGNEIEKHTRATTTYQVHVRMEDGASRTFSYQQQPGWGIGDRVRVVNGQLASRA
ncbi:MAG TPA: glycine zipper 2TM domain-containing protein [Noviherbaspirillum sp.]|jgi:outer membrane lipoprotein SlyB|uniref:glycine zipper 2TM domain-containing protein n=1 Tax=Noviherbaspirillum sp. TaxID=1926288 RepID=UPI002F91FACB